MLPQGMEMLFTMAFAFGRHSAAKLVEFGFLAATPTLSLRIGRRLGLPDRASLVAAVFYFCAPVAGLTGTASYNEAALVFFTLAAFYLLLVWRDTGEAWYLAGGWSGGGILLRHQNARRDGVGGRGALGGRIGRRRRWRELPLLAAGALPAVAPWLVRNAWVAGNPLAPLGNALFPNPYFHSLSERMLAANLAA